MSRSSYPGPRLPKTLLDQVHGGRVSKSQHGHQFRKDRRQAERQQKKTPHPRPRPTAPSRRAAAVAALDDGQSEEGLDEAGDDSATPDPGVRTAKLTTRVSKTKPKSLSSNARSPSYSDEASDEEAAPVVSKSANSRLQEDDAEIAALEKKLGIKGRKSKALEEDGLDWLIGDSENESDDGEDLRKRKRPEDEKWLRDKRRRAQNLNTAERDEEQSSDGGNSGDTDDIDEEDDDDDFGDLEDLENRFSEDEFSVGEFEGFDSDGAGQPQKALPARKRENPYVAPVSKEVSSETKYVPPSLRKPPSSDEEALKQLRRQLQGLLNRLSEANLLSILQSIEQVYTQNARQHVTSTLIDMLVGLVSDPAVLNDTFLILHAGFATALYKVVGTDFGAQLLERLVQAFDHFQDEGRAEGKQTLNLIAFLADLYSLQAIGSEVIFDYIRLLLDRISESNTELLLRVIRVSGKQLRQDDPTSLKDIVLLLQRAVAEAGEQSLSVRTKFMIETIQDLKNNRMKVGATSSTNAAEHLQRMKKTLGSLNARAKSTEPLRITLADIRDSEKKGKWWLVGASYKNPVKMAEAERDRSNLEVALSGNESDDESDASNELDLYKLARAQGMNTDVRRAIFVSIAGAVDYKHAHMRLMKLNLKSKQLVEIPRVLLHCVGAEETYNHYYTIIAREFCGDHKLRKAYHFVLLDIFRRMGERDDVDRSDDESDTKDMTVRKIYNLAKMFATLLADGLLRITILKTLDFSDLQPKTQVFVEVLLITVITLLRKKGRDAFEAAVKDVFQAAHAAPDMVSGLRYYVSTILSNTEIASSKKEQRIIIKGCEEANAALLEAPSTAFVLEDESYAGEDDFD